MSTLNSDPPCIRVYTLTVVHIRISSRNVGYGGGGGGGGGGVGGSTLIKIMGVVTEFLLDTIFV